MRVATAAIAALLLASPAMAQTTMPKTEIAPTGESFYNHQAGDMRASKLIGTNVVNAANETVGEINEVVLNKDGKVAAIIVGVGGFLGMGEREVAMSYSSLRFAKDSSNRDVITVNATKEQLKSAPAWKWDTTRPQ